MTTVLLTGFEPFGGASANSSWDAVRLVERDWSHPATLVTACLPVEFGRAGDELLALVEEHTPDVVVATGVAGGRTKVTPERIAVNLQDARIPDNAGAQPIDRAIAEDGPDARFTRLPVRAMVDRMITAGVPAELSLSAGAYVCNDLMYRMLHDLDGRSIVAGFVHVPDATELPVATSARGLLAGLEACLA